MPIIVMDFTNGKTKISIIWVDKKPIDGGTTSFLPNRQLT